MTIRVCDGREEIDQGIFRFCRVLLCESHNRKQAADMGSKQLESERRSGSRKGSIWWPLSWVSCGQSSEGSELVALRLDSRVSGG